MPSFDTAVARVTEEPDEYPFDFDIVERDPDDDKIVNTVKCWCREPAEGELIVLVTDLMGRRSKTQNQLAGIIDFLVGVLDDESRDYVVDRLLDPHDPFGLQELNPILEWMVEEWGGRPTKQPSDYAPSRKNGGPRSTPRTSKSTSSRSRSTASSTRSTAGA